MEMRAYHLQVNHLNRPVGIDGGNLRVSWRLEGWKISKRLPGDVRTAGGEILETTGKVPSGETFCRLTERIPWRSRARISLRRLG